MDTITAAVLLQSMVLLVACADDSPTAIAGDAFGARYHVTLRGHAGAPAVIKDEIDRLLDEIDLHASSWRGDSWVSKFNTSDETRSVAVPEHVWAMLVVAEQVHRDSGGAFDVTAGPLVELWGFGAGPRGQASPPSEIQVAVALAHVGMDKLVLDHEAKTVAKRVPTVTIDLSALAKGYAIDRIAAMLDERGAAHYLIAFGGEVRAKGHRAGSEGWVVAIENPDGLSDQATLTLLNQAVATSGGSQQHRKQAGEVVATHLIDPRTGRAVTDARRSMTVLADRGALADAWATALAVDRRPAVEQASRRAGLSYEAAD